MNSDYIQQIENWVQKGDYPLAKAKINQLKAKELLTDKHRFYFSLWFWRMGNFNKALKILGKELDQQQLALAKDEFTLRVQARLSFMLSFVGAHQSALRIINNINGKLLSFNQFLKNFAGTYYSYLAAIYLRHYDYLQAQKYYELALEQMTFEKSPYQYLLYRLGWADCLEAQGKFEEAKQIVLTNFDQIKQDQTILLAIHHSALGEYYLRQNNLKQAEINLFAAFQLFPSTAESSDYAILLKWLGVYYLKQEERQKAREYLKKSERIFSKNTINPSSLLEVYFWQQTSSKNGRLIWPYAAVATHPINSPLGVLLGRLHNNEKGLAYWIKEQYVQNYKTLKVTKILFDCWLFAGNEVKKCSYSKGIISHHSYVDLVSGVLCKNNCVYDLLPQIRCQCLFELISAGPLGINVWALIDKLYPNQWLDLTSIILRIEDLIKNLKLQGFEIARRNSTYFWRASSAVPVLVSMDHQYHGIWRHFKTRMLSKAANTFTCKDLEAIYPVHSRTVKRWIKQGLEDQQIEKMGAGSRTVYSFRTTVLS